MTFPATEPTAADDRNVQLKAAGLLIAVFVVVGALAGILWQAWSPQGPVGVVLSGGIQAADEKEKFVGGDGRFLVITAAVGVAIAVLAWLLRWFRAARGPYVALGLAVGGLAGAALTEWVGYMIRGAGNTFACTAASGKCIDHLPLTVHMHALLLTEAVLAVLVYSLLVAFAVDDDLGRPDPASVRVEQPAAAWAAAPAPTVPSVGTQGDAQQPWGYGDASGPSEQDQLAP